MRCMHFFFSVYMFTSKEITRNHLLVIGFMLLEPFVMKCTLSHCFFFLSLIIQILSLPQRKIKQNAVASSATLHLATNQTGSTTKTITKLTESYLPAIMQVLAHNIELLQYEPLHSTTIEPPFTVSTTPLTLPNFSSSSSTKPTTQQPVTWWSPPSTTTTQRPTTWWSPPSTTSTTTTAKPTTWWSPPSTIATTKAPTTTRAPTTTIAPTTSKPVTSSVQATTTERPFWDQPSTSRKPGSWYE